MTESTNPSVRPNPTKGVRERTRDAIRAELAAAAISAFQEEGFNASTVESIAARVGVSGRTFFRYFASKEDAVLQPMERLGADAAQRLGQRPSEEGTVQALRASLEVVLEAVLADQPLMRAVMTLNRSAPELRRRHLQQQDEWVDQLAVVVARRTGLREDSPSARLPCTVVLAAFEKALGVCADDDDFSQIGRQFDEALAEVGRLFHP
ncbi:AcrR family transcriptional regulator [Kineococcus radiotolerans]|uniref:AcrR family transcriptional regulator n=1 Tax=Kineococcus radiotolerans TaxID=131568 RepID=A0A7W4TQF4_KINRA|nr:TetR family transcriptional regulator [Kineococcus radiotolerans]MBB2903216.1 AcrR family transcriptional regulator [Kineococcus radiotolerans]